MGGRQNLFHSILIFDFPIFDFLSHMQDAGKQCSSVRQQSAPSNFQTLNCQFAVSIVNS